MDVARLAIVTLVWLVAGCALQGTTPPSTFYMLRTTSTEKSTSGLEALAIGIGPVSVAEYLDRPQIVTRTGGVEVIVDQYHRWAGPVREAIVQIVVGEIAIQTGSQKVFSFPWPPATRLDYQLKANVGRFDATETGLARMEVHWGLYVENQDMFARRSVYEAQAVGEGYAARVTALNDVLRQFARDVVATLAELTPSA